MPGVVPDHRDRWWPPIVARPAASRQGRSIGLCPPEALQSLRLTRHALVVGAPLVYVVALAIVIASWGLPIARDQLFLWLGLGMAAFSAGAWRSWGGMLLEWLPFFGLLVAYDYLRGAVSVAPGRAHVAAQQAVDSALAGGELPTVWLQRHLWSSGHPHWYDYGVWAVYMTHFFVVWVVAAVLWRVSRRCFRRYAVLTVVLTLAAFLTYWLYPAQPPWLAGNAGHMPAVDRIVPEVWDHLGVGSVQSVYENGHLVNTVAAMPSLHAAYPFMLLLFFWRAGWLLRIGLGLYTLAMAFALVYGGEHFVADILAGWAMAAAAFALVTAAAALARRPRRRRFPARWRPSGACARAGSRIDTAQVLTIRDARISPAHVYRDRAQALEAVGLRE